MDKFIEISSNEFKALSSETRTQMIKLLQERNYTLTELSKKLNMAAPTIKQHLNILQQAGFIEGIDEGRKWKYYTLTRKGKNIFSHETPANVLIVLGVSIIAMVGLLYGFVSIAGFQSHAVFLKQEMAAPTLEVGLDKNPMAYEAGESAATAGEEAPKNDITTGMNARQSEPMTGATSGVADDNAFTIIGAKKGHSTGTEGQCIADSSPAQYCSVGSCPELPFPCLGAMLAAIVALALLIGFSAARIRQ